MEKIKLPKEVMEAVQTKFDHYNQEGMAYMMLECSSVDDVIRKWIDSEKENIVTLSQALVELYKTVKTPEENFIEYYEVVKRRTEEGKSESIKEHFGYELMGILTTLSKLNIKIEGVNT